jgi:hypothetical protein
MTNYREKLLRKIGGKLNIPMIQKNTKGKSMSAHSETYL